MSDTPTTPLARPTPQRPLIGLTVLAVEDSRYASEALRLMCLRSGARIRRADCLRAARRHLAAYRPSVAVVDLGLPDGRGEDLIAEIVAMQPRIPVILGSSGADDAEGAARDAGADGFLAKPIDSLAVFQQAILGPLADPERSAPRALPADRIAPDPLALRDDLVHAAAVLAPRRGAEPALDYAAQFLQALGRSAGDRDLERAAGQVARGRTGRVGRMLRDRIAAAPTV